MSLFRRVLPQQHFKCLAIECPQFRMAGSSDKGTTTVGIEPANSWPWGTAGKEVNAAPFQQLVKISSPWMPRTACGEKKWVRHENPFLEAEAEAAKEAARMESKAAFVLKEIKTQKGNHFLWKNVSHSLSLSLTKVSFSLCLTLSLSHPIFISGILSLTNTLSHNGCLSLSLTHTLSLSPWCP